MAANVFRFRRSLALVSSTLNQTLHISSVAAPPFSTAIKHQNPNPNPSLFNFTQLKPVMFKFESSRAISSRARYNNNDDMDGDQISPDAILFEGCDYNHWLITMDFPRDNKPSPEEMVETYVQTAAKVLGSVEEAKKKIYACSTTTYNGFQVEVSEEVSEQFKALPGVVFVLPDSYIDPVNKEYGGDKYINGTIIPRPPPVQYGRQGGRYNDRNRDYNRPPPRGQMGQNIAPPGGQGSYQGDRRGPMPSYQGNYNQGRPADFPQRDQGNFTPSEQNSQGGGGGSFRQGGGGQYGQRGGGSYGQGSGGQFGQTGGGDYGQGAGGQYGQGGGGNYGQGAGGQYGQGGGGTYGQGTGGQYGQGGGGSYGQGAGAQYGQGGGGGSYGQGSGGQYGQVSGGNYGQRPGGQYGQGSGGNYGHGTGGQYGENQRFSQVDQRSNIGGQQRNHEVTEEADAFKVKDDENVEVARNVNKPQKNGVY